MSPRLLLLCLLALGSIAAVSATATAQTATTPAPSSGPYQVRIPAPGLLIKAHPRKPYCPAATGGIAGAGW